MRLLLPNKGLKIRRLAFVQLSTKATVPPPQSPALSITLDRPLNFPALSPAGAEALTSLATLSTGVRHADRVSIVPTFPIGNRLHAGWRAKSRRAEPTRRDAPSTLYASCRTKLIAWTPS